MGPDPGLDFEQIYQVFLLPEKEWNRGERAAFSIWVPIKNNNLEVDIHLPKSVGIQRLGNEYSVRDSSTLSSDPLCRINDCRWLSDRRALTADATWGKTLKMIGEQQKTNDWRWIWDTCQILCKSCILSISIKSYALSWQTCTECHLA